MFEKYKKIVMNVEFYNCARGSLPILLFVLDNEKESLDGTFPDVY